MVSLRKLSRHFEVRQATVSVLVLLELDELFAGLLGVETKVAIIYELLTVLPRSS